VQTRILSLFDVGGITALYREVQSGHEDCVRLLLEALADAKKAENTAAAVAARAAAL